MSQLSNEELGQAVVAYYRNHGNQWRTSADVHTDAFTAYDKVRFQLVFSNMYLKPPHLMVKRDNPNGRGAEWRLRESSDPVFVPPVKIPRKKRVEIEQAVAAPAPEPLAPSRIAHRSVPMVTETPPERRKHEPDSLHVEHRSLGAPPNNALADQLAKLRPQVAAFSAAAPYEVPPTVKVESIPVGVHSTTVRAKGEAPLPSMIMAGVAEVTRKAFEPTEEYKAPTVRELIKEKLLVNLTRGPDFDKAEELEKSADLIPPQLGTAGQLFEAMLALAAPALKNMITEAMVAALTSKEVAAILTPPPAEKVEVSGEPSLTVATVKPASQAKPRLPKVCVIGLPKSLHEEAIKREFGGLLDVNTVSTDARPPMIISACRQADYVVLLTDHANHKAAYALQSAHIEFDRIKGGIQKASDYLRNVVAIHK